MLFIFRMPRTEATSQKTTWWNGDRSFWRSCFDSWEDHSRSQTSWV